MSTASKIEWTDATWNPVTGCDKVSPGCDHCYAETIAHRFVGTKAYPDGFKVTLRPERLDQPLRWRRPRRIFVNSMSDLFHDAIPDAYIGTVFDVMARAERHTFQVLTKRHGRMRSLLKRWAAAGIETDLGYVHPPHRPLGSVRRTGPRWTPPPNVWLGVSVEDQKWADVRIPKLLETPAAVRFLSCEPLLGAVTLHRYLPNGWGEGARHNPRPSMLSNPRPTIDWVIVGGESGHGARPMHPDWARSLRDQCVAAGVAFSFKQWGEWRPLAGNEYSNARDEWPEGTHGRMMRRVGKKVAGRVLDGRTWDQYPEAATP